MKIFIIHNKIKCYYIDLLSSYIHYLVFCGFFNDLVPTPLAVGSVLAEMRAKMVSISKEKHSDSPLPPGSKQTINGSARIIAI